MSPQPPTMLARLKENATPLLIGAAAGAAVALTVSALTSKNARNFTLFPVSKATLVGSLAKIAMIAVGRTLLRGALARAAEHVASQSA